jgi:hypothetical protein
MTTDTIFVDTDPGVGFPETNHYYLVESVSGDGYRSDKSDTVGEFDKLLE